jgi:archaellum component FlaC
MATRSAMAMATKSAEEDENPQMNNLTASKSAMSMDQAVEKILTMVMSRGDKQDNQINKQDNQIDKMADIMRTMSDTIKSMRESYQNLSESFLKLQQRVNKLESEVKGVKMSFDNDIKEIKINVDKAGSSEIFKELAWREERSKKLILFKIDESDSNSWNETKTYE